ncbi:4-hydroxythreonine-4-phosphate dehydrogenase PdxA [Kordiimonas sp. SCSIO 12610]|uniref:4-hydroxythreonine-4-phosphate dehydrogenase PdxA n=1 Tax=Kordiimonas sp. SCSIO 12610 TaxID=2829597 RepID=UPI00210E0F61|nr:4-hydroxythreonine-4-phosphate dehydrogenase PdxA [Kordiimonas sp. SCSIO 12610]UTW53874.1 4-hydroxythreonine-4-phosphate dehydrogenase PdxA [Kordiimonas sp. SCSIO 12610]
MSQANTQEFQSPIAITMGEPSGIGPEIFCSIWENRKALSLPQIVYIGSVESLSVHNSNIKHQLIDCPSKVHNIPEDTLAIIPVKTTETIVPGTLNSANGKAVIQSINLAVSFVIEGKVSAIVTSPIHKAALYDIGFSSPGHTEYLAERAGMPKSASVMMLATEGLRVVPVTTHIALKDVAKHLTHEKIIHSGFVTNADLQKRFNIENPRIAIAALNPHAGENGAMGIEEVTHILPAVIELRDQGINVTDPLPADTLFHEEARKNYDAILCMYHDQALIPLKTLDFWGGVNITLGLPFIRTSPDHGTAIDLAGKGKARPDSMIAAIKYAQKLAENQLEFGNE